VNLLKRIHMPRASTLLLVGVLTSFPLFWYAAPDAKTADDRSVVFWQWILPVVLANWIVADARERRHAVCYDYDTFQFWAWPLLAPVYLIQTRGWRALWPVLCFGLMLLLAGFETILLLVVFPK
jgi:hypothetical protein